MALWTKLKPEWEADVRERLERTRQWLFSSEGARLLAALRTRCPELVKAYVVEQFSDDGDIHFMVVVGPDLIAFVERDRLSSEADPVITLQSAREYRQQHPQPGRDVREGVEVAVQLMRE